MSNLYNEDYNLWTEQQIKALQDRNIDALDWDNLALDLDYPRYWINSELTMLICSLLELYSDFNGQDYEQEHWKTFVDTNRLKINGILEDYPGYFDKIKANVSKTYPRAVKLMLRRGKARKIKQHLPGECPFTFEEIIKEGWYPTVDN